MDVKVPPVYESFEVGELKPQKDMDMLVGLGEVILDKKDAFQVFIFQNKEGKRGAALDNKFDLKYLDKVKEARGKEITEDAAGVSAAITELDKAKPPILDKVLEKWAEIAKDLDFEVGKPPKLEGELAEVWKDKEKAEAEYKKELEAQRKLAKA